MSGAKRIPRRLQASLLEGVFEVLMEAGATIEDIQAGVDTCLSDLRGKRRGSRKAKSGAYLQCGDLSADLMRLWHRDEKYLDADVARPKPLHLRRGKESIREMIRSLDPQVNVANVESFLISSGLIKKQSDGRFLPANDAGMISHKGQFVAEHLVKSVNRLIRTIRRNSSLGAGKGTLIERFAYVSDLQRDEIDAFCNFTKAQGHSYLQVVDDWMEQRRMRPRKSSRAKQGRGVLAGVQVIAYLGDGLGVGGFPGAKRKRGSEGSDLRD